MINPCTECKHYDSQDGACLVKIKIGDATFHSSVPDRRIAWVGENKCGPEGKWFEPLKK